jgi:hypothetical protein
VPAPLNIGIADPPRADGVHTRFGPPVGDLPVYTLRRKTTGEVKIVTDPGRALITGRWKDVGRFKGPILPGLAGRGPSFRNGSAATPLDVVNLYDRRFIGLSEQDESDPSCSSVAVVAVWRAASAGRATSRRPRRRRRPATRRVTRHPAVSAAAIARVDLFDSRPALTYSRDDSAGQPCAGVPTRPGGPPWSRCS